MTLRTTLSTALTLMIAASALAACGGARAGATSASGGVPGEGAPVATLVRPRAAYELRCDAQRLEIEEIARGTYHASGCGAEATYTCVGSMGQYACQRDGDIAGTLAAAPPPATGRDVTQAGAPVSTIVLPRATQELSCAGASIEVREIASKTFVANGCGQEALYTCVGAMGHYQCQRE